MGLLHRLRRPAWTLAGLGAFSFQAELPGLNGSFSSSDGRCRIPGYSFTVSLTAVLGSPLQVGFRGGLPGTMGKCIGPVAQGLQAQFPGSPSSWSPVKDIESYPFDNGVQCA
jgi:hypothetical protein